MESIVEFGVRISGIDYVNREGIYGILIKHGKLAVVETPRGYFLPGGGLEPSETHAECLRRELIEEIGVEVSLGDYIGKSVLYDMSPKDKVYYNMFGTFYFVKEINKLTKLEDDHELVWMTLKEAKEKLKLVHQAWVIDEVMKKC